MTSCRDGPRRDPIIKKVNTQALVLSDSPKFSVIPPLTPDKRWRGEEVVEEQIEYDYRHEKRLTVVSNVPAGVCRQCGEKYFKPEVLKRMDSLYHGIFGRNEKPDPFRSGSITLTPPTNRAVSPQFVQLVNNVPFSRPLPLSGKSRYARITLPLQNAGDASKKSRTSPRKLKAAGKIPGNSLKTVKM